MSLSPPSGGIPQCFAHASSSPRPSPDFSIDGGSSPPPLPSRPHPHPHYRGDVVGIVPNVLGAMVNNSTHPHGDIKYTRCMNTGLPLTAKGRERQEEDGEEGGEEEDEERERKTRRGIGKRGRRRSVSRVERGVSRVERGVRLQEGS